MRTAAVLLGFAGAVLAFFASAQQPEPATPPWRIRGELTEACTCSPPCSCNFGERPSPHDYCWAMWSYWIKEGRRGEVDLAGTHLAGVEAEAGVRGILDAGLSPEKRSAAEQIWHALSGRLLCHVRLWPFKAGPAPLDPAAPKQGSLIRTRYVDRKFLGFVELEIEQAIGPAGVRLQLGDRGGFEADYIFGRDASQPITVRNIVSWPIAESIKGKTRRMHYRDDRIELDVAGTNANQGVFDLTQESIGARAMTAPAE